MTDKRDVSLLGQLNQTEIAALADQCLELTDEQIAERLCGIDKDRQSENEATHETSQQSEENRGLFPGWFLVDWTAKLRERECVTEECDLWSEQSSKKFAALRSSHV